MTQIDLENFEPQIIQTQDEEGEVHEFELIDVVTIDDVTYGLLVYLNEESENEDEEEVVIMRLGKEGEQFTFESIEDEEEFNKVLEVIQSELQCECECGDECDDSCECSCHDGDEDENEE